METATSSLQERDLAREYFKKYTEQGNLPEDVLDFINFISVSDQEKEQEEKNYLDEKKQKKNSGLKNCLE